MYCCDWIEFIHYNTPAEMQTYIDMKKRLQFRYVQIAPDYFSNITEVPFVFWGGNSFLLKLIVYILI